MWPIHGATIVATSVAATVSCDQLQQLWKFESDAAAYGYEGWILRKTDQQKIEAFEIL